MLIEEKLKKEKWNSDTDLTVIRMKRTANIGLFGRLTLKS